MDSAYTKKSSQEQAVAYWIDYLNQISIDRLIGRLSEEQVNLEQARKTIHETIEIIDKDIVNKGKGLGGTYGMRGFIAEVAQCGLGNAKRQIEGEAKNYCWINDNGPADLMRDGIGIQLKFVESGGHLSLRAVLEHMKEYPDFLKNGNKYQIPADHYQSSRWL